VITLHRKFNYANPNMLKRLVEVRQARSFGSLIRLIYDQLVSTRQAREPEFMKFELRSDN